MIELIVNVALGTLLGVAIPIGSILFLAGILFLIHKMQGGK